MNDSRTPKEPKVSATAASSNHNLTHHERNLIQPAEDILKKTPKRVKGISRKFLLRAINRRIIVRLARRASIGIPLLGFYFAQNTFRNDLSQALNKENASFIRSGYKVVTAIDGIDLAAQTFMISGLVSTLYFQTTDIAMISFPEIMKYADKVSIGCALASTLLGTYIELKKEHDLEVSQEHANSTEDACNHVSRDETKSLSEEK